MKIYKLTSPSGKSYIGITQKSVKRRLQEHIYSAVNNSECKIHKALRKYPIQNWTIETIETCSSREELCERERYYIDHFDTYKNGYNMTLGGDGVDPESASKFRKEWFQTEEGQKWKQHLSDAFKKNNPCKKGNIPWNKGRIGLFKHSEDTKMILSQKHSGIPKSLEHRRKISMSKRGKPSNKKVWSTGWKQSEYQKKTVAEKLSATWKVQFPDGEVKIVKNLNSFCRENGLDPGNLKKTLPGGVAKQHKGFVLFEKLESSLSPNNK